MDSLIANSGVTLAIIGAMFSALLGGYGSCVGIGTAGVKGTGILAENPSLFSKMLMMTVLPGSQGVYGLLMAILILNKVGVISGLDEGSVVSIENGQQLMYAGVLMGISGLTSGWFQGKVVAGAMGAIARDESLMGRAIVLAVIIETYAIFGLLISVFIWNSITI